MALSPLVNGIKSNDKYGTQSSMKGGMKSNSYHMAEVKPEHTFSCVKDSNRTF